MAYDLQTLDPLCREKVAEVLQNSGEGRAYHITNGVLFFKAQIIIPAQGALQKELLKAHYNNPRTGHGGAGRTFKLLNQNFH